MAAFVKVITIAASPAGRKAIGRAVRVARSDEGKKLIAQARKVAASPEGRKLVEQARRAAKDASVAARSPANRSRLEAIRAAMAKRKQ